MPRALDTERLEDPSMKMLDIGNPPTKNIPHAEYPKMVYLHPKDKTKEHRVLVVNSSDELDNAEKIGYRLQPHIPEPPPVDLSGFEIEYETIEKRGPGRPKVN